MITELFSATVFIGILASVAIPEYLKFASRAKTVEAKTILRAIFEMQVAYLGEHEDYADTPDELGIASIGHEYYDVKEVCTSKPCTDLFTAQVEGNIDKDPDVDIWATNQDAFIWHINAD